MSNCHPPSVPTAPQLLSISRDRDTPLGSCVSTRLLLAVGTVPKVQPDPLLLHREAVPSHPITVTRGQRPTPPPHHLLAAVAGSNKVTPSPHRSAPTHPTPSAAPTALCCTPPRPAPLFALPTMPLAFLAPGHSAGPRSAQHQPTAPGPFPLHSLPATCSAARGAVAEAQTRTPCTRDHEH